MSLLSNLAPLLILLTLAIIGGVVGYIVYTVAHDVKHHTRQKMERHSVSFSREGVKVGVKELNTEKYADSQQNVLVKVWNAASWPAYQSRLGWGQGKPEPERPSVSRHSSSVAGTPASTPGVGTEKRKPFSRSSSSQQSVTRVSSHTNTPQQAARRPSPNPQ